MKDYGLLQFKGQDQGQGRRKLLRIGVALRTASRAKTIIMLSFLKMILIMVSYMLSIPFQPQPEAGWTRYCKFSFIIQILILTQNSSYWKKSKNYSEIQQIY